MEEILERFEKKYGHLKAKGLKFKGLAEIDAEKRIKVIVISKPFVFDGRLIPDKYEGIRIRRHIHGKLPTEFKIRPPADDGTRVDFIWAPERFEKFVDRKMDSIRERLQSPEMSREEILDALCFGDFKAHKAKVEQWIADGVVPAYTEPID